MALEGLLRELENDARRFEAIKSNENTVSTVVAEDENIGNEKVLVEERRVNPDFVTVHPSPLIKENDWRPPSELGESKRMEDKPTPRIIIKRVLTKGKEMFAIKNVEECTNEKEKHSNSRPILNQSPLQDNEQNCVSESIKTNKTEQKKIASKAKVKDSSPNLKQYNEENGRDFESVKKSRKSRVKRPRNEKIKEVVKSGSSPKKRERSSPNIPSKKHKSNSSKKAGQVSLKQETVSVIEVIEDSKKSCDSTKNCGKEKTDDPYNFQCEDEKSGFQVSYAQSREYHQKKFLLKKPFGSYVPDLVEKDCNKCRKSSPKLKCSGVYKKAKVPSSKSFRSSVPPQLQKVDKKSGKSTNELHPKLANSSYDLKKANDSPQKLEASQLRGIEKKGKVIESITKSNKAPIKQTEGSNKGKAQVLSKELIPHLERIYASHVERVDGDKEFKKTYDNKSKSLVQGQSSGVVNNECVAKYSKKSNKLQTIEKDGASKSKVKDSSQNLNEIHLPGIVNNICVTKSSVKSNKPQAKQMKGTGKGKVSFKKLPESIVPSSKKVQKIGDKKTGNDTYELYQLPNSASDLKEANDSSEKLPKSISSSPKKEQKVDDKKAGKDTTDLDPNVINETGDLKKANETKKKPTRRKKGTRKGKRPSVKKSTSTAASNFEKLGDHNSGRKKSELQSKESEKEISINFLNENPPSHFNRRQHVKKRKKPKVKLTEVPKSRKIWIVPRIPFSRNIPLEADQSVYRTCLPSLRATEELLAAHAQAHNTPNTLPENVSRNVRDKAELFIKNILLTIKEQRSKKPELTGTPINMDDLALALKVHLAPFPPRPLA